MERLSALMDDELEEHAIDGELERIKGDPQREEAWATYHMIGDALRGQIDPVQGVAERVHSMLADEPTVLAPRSWRANRTTQRVVLPLAASVCGIAVVAWLALSNNATISPVNDAVTTDVLATAPQAVQQPFASIADGSQTSGTAWSGIESSGSESNSSAADDMSEYLMAHQQFSPSTAMQGVVPYVRTVSSGDGAR